MKRRALLSLLPLLALSPSGCAHLPAILRGAGLGAQWLGSLVDVAEDGSDAYFARHPSQDREEQVKARISQARLAVKALNAVLLAAEATGDQDVTTAKQEALTAYAALRELLDSMGVLEAVAPAGGAEGDAPVPEPFELPTADEVASRL